MFVLNTHRLILRDLTQEDFDAFYAAADDAEVQRYYPVEERPAEFYRSIFERILEQTKQPERDKYQLAICLPSGQVIGTCGVRLEDPVHMQASFGCGIARPYWGHSYAFEASREIIRFSLRSLPIHRLYAETIKENVRARRLAERLGMRLEGELLQTKLIEGQWFSTAVYALLKEEWERMR
jgi:[ribosomal protein S5]-alanine N-acetyltransferase